ncbi:MAG: diguanylate cyclase [Acidobacteriota bacterium]
MSDACYPEFLLASADAQLIERTQPVLAGLGRLQVHQSAETLLQAAAELPQSLVALDTRLPGMEVGQLLAAMRALPGGSVSPIVLFSDTVTEEWRERLREGVISDVMPLSITRDFVAVRLGMVLAAQTRERELERLRERDATTGVTDPLTGVYNRSALVPLLFRETDRVQRMKTSLCLILMDIDDFGHWNLRLGTGACDDLLAQMAGRVRRMLRSYDLLGRMGKDEFLVALPGCTAVNAMTLAERIRQEVFATPFQAAGKTIRLSACFAVASSQGRSPVVVLRELEEGLAVAKQDGPETIRMAAEWLRAKPAPVEFLSQTAGEDLVAW